MITVNMQPATVEVESVGGWRLDGKPVAPGTRVTVLSSLAADLVARGKARVVEPAAPGPAPVEAVVPEAPPAPETPPAPAPAARGKK